MELKYNLDELDSVVRLIAKELKVPKVVLLKGELGAGKTTLVKAICLHLGVSESVSSPTYSLANVYKGDILIYHLDLYRIKTIDEAMDMGIEDYLYDKKAVTLIEWPEIIDSIIPEDRVEIQITVLDNGLRKAEILRADVS